MTHRPRALEWSPGAAGPLLGAEPDLTWQDAAGCQWTDPEAFFPGKGESVRAAKRVCAACPVKAECLQYALENGERFGIWGGLSERQRRRLSPDKPAQVPRLCRKRLHVMDEENRDVYGHCLACQPAPAARLAEPDRAARTGDPAPRSGRRLAA
jgi:WhiB family redox-sensing transcriptional regulator